MTREDAIKTMNKSICPKCKSSHTEEHGAEPGDYKWWLCRKCGFNWPTKGSRSDMKGSRSDMKGDKNND